MSKVSFRARALDASKPMAIFKADEVPDLPDFATINRSVPQMPTGMEKEEETEHHLQRALSAQQVYGTSEALVIPIPEVEDIADRYEKLYNDGFKQPKQYIHIQAFGMEQEIPDYDMDSEDELWVNEQSKKMEITPLKFEEMMDRLEKGSGQQVVTLQEAKLLLKEDDDLIIAAYDYWLNKRLKLAHPLILSVKTEKRDGSTTNNPYVAFRRRTEKMQTRKNRKNDETSYEKMLKLKRDLNRAVTILELIKRREKSKKELLQLTIEVLEKRYQLEDFNGTMLQEAEALRHKIPSTFLPYSAYAPGWGQVEENVVRKKRDYKKRKHKHALSSRENTSAPSSYHDIDVLHTDAYSSEDEGMSPGMSPSDHEDENDPDGPFAFRRKRSCNYFAPILNRLGNWPWHSPDDGGLGDKKYRYNLMSLSQPQGCQGFCRRRIGRGGRVLIDRAFTPWDDHLQRLDLSPGTSFSGNNGDYITYIREKKVPHFRPHSPTDDIHSVIDRSCDRKKDEDVEFNLESFQSHKEQVRQMHLAQEEQLLDTCDIPSSNCSNNVEHSSSSSQSTSRFTLDSASAKFAVSAVLNSCQLQSAKSSGATVINPSITTSLSSSSASSSTGASLLSASVIGSSSSVSHAAVTSAAKLAINGPIASTKTAGLSSSPAATVLQLNFPLNVNNNKSAGSPVPVPQQPLLPSQSTATAAASPILTLPTTTLASNNAHTSKTVSAAVNSNIIYNFTSNHEEVGKLNNIHVKRENTMAMDVT